MSDERTLANHGPQAVPEKRFMHREQQYQERLEEVMMSNTQLAIRVQTLAGDCDALKKELSAERAEAAKLRAKLADYVDTVTRIAAMADTMLS
jgi:predicted nuclease with TOPRIM domain